MNKNYVKSRTKNRSCHQKVGRSISTMVLQTKMMREATSHPKRDEDTTTYIHDQTASTHVLHSHQQGQQIQQQSRRRIFLIHHDCMINESKASFHKSEQTVILPKKTKTFR